MTGSHDTRLTRLEQGQSPRRTVHLFLPLGIAHTDAAPGWIEDERQRLGVTERDELLVFSWMQGEAA